MSVYMKYSLDCFNINRLITCCNKDCIVAKHFKFISKHLNLYEPQILASKIQLCR